MNPEVEPKKCIECGKTLPKIHEGDVCIVCEYEIANQEDESFVRFNKQKKNWK